MLSISCRRPSLAMLSLIYCCGDRTISKFITEVAFLDTLCEHHIERNM
jgi:hypothetical protein